MCIQVNYVAPGESFEALPLARPSGYICGYRLDCTFMFWRIAFVKS